MIELLRRINPDELGGMIAVIVIVALGVGVVPGWLLYFDLQKRKLLFEERRAIIEKGMVPPPIPVKSPAETMALWGMYTAKMQRQQLQFEERRLMIEKGMTPPPFDENVATDSERNLGLGIIMLSLGIGLSVGYFALTPSNEFKGLIGFAGPILAFLGAGFIVYSRMTKDQRTNKSSGSAAKVPE